MKRDVLHFSQPKALSSISLLSLSLWLALPLDLSLEPLIKADLWLPRAIANHRITRPDSAAEDLVGLKSHRPPANPTAASWIMHSWLRSGETRQRHCWFSVSQCAARLLQTSAGAKLEEMWKTWCTWWMMQDPPNKFRLSKNLSKVRYFGMSEKLISDKLR